MGVFVNMVFPNLMTNSYGSITIDFLLGGMAMFYVNLYWIENNTHKHFNKTTSTTHPLTRAIWYYSIQVLVNNECVARQRSCVLKPD